MSAVVGRSFSLSRGPWKTLDPFLFCVFHDDRYPASAAGSLGPDPALLRGRDITMDFSYQDGWSMYHGTSVPGFPSHPHRGFETVTVVRKGLVDHFDSLGATGRYGHGDTQWLTTGDGVQHSEMFPLVNPDTPNPLELFQLWLNLPAKSKASPAHFKMFWAPDIPRVTVDDAEVLVVAGGALGGARPPSPPPASWASDEHNEVAIWIIRLPPGGRCRLPAAAGGGAINRAVYFFRGDAARVSVSSGITGQSDADITLREAIQLNAGVNVELSASPEGPAELLVLQGRPIGEPVVQRGPFVTNSQRELDDTYRLYHKTLFGGWPWPRSDYTHPREQKRFAKYPDGRIEEGPPLTTSK